MNFINNLNKLLTSTCSKTPPNSKVATNITDIDGTCYCSSTSDGLAVSVIADKEYPEKVAFFLINTVLNDFRMKVDERDYMYT